MKHELQTLLKHKLQWLLLLAALLGVSQGVWGESTTIYVKKSGLFSTNSPYIHYWGDGETTWPGTELTTTTTGADGTWYKITINKSVPNLILHDNKGNQTANITRGSNTWYVVAEDKNYTASTSDPDIVELYVRGIGSWDPTNDNKMSENDGVFTLTTDLNSGIGCSFKIGDATWGSHNYGKDDLSIDCDTEETLQDNKGDISFTPASTGSHTFRFTLSTKKLEIICPAPSCTSPTSVSASPASATPKLDAATISQTLTATPSGGTGTPDYEWSITSNPNSGASITSGGATATPTVSFTRTGTYVFNVKAGCDIENSDYVQNTCTVTVSKSTNTYYLKHPWNGDGWTWQTMTADDDVCEWTYVGQFGGGENKFDINTTDNDDGKEYQSGATITGSPTKGDMCVFAFVPSTAGGKTGTASITKIQTYTITGAVNEGTGGSISPTSVAAIEGQTVTFTATPSSGYSVEKWNDGSDHVTTATTFDYTVGTSAQTVTVYFQCNAPSVTPGYETSTAQTICEGETALSLSVTESGYVSSRKWQRKGTGLSDDWGDISSSSSTTYNVPNDAASSYYYRYVATGCATTTSVSSSLYTVNANPSTPSITSYDESVCSGSAPKFTFASTSGLTYQMYVGGSTSGDDITGDGASQTLTAGTITSATTFNLRATNSTTGCYSSSSGATVGITPDMALTSITLTPNTICTGGESTATANSVELGGGTGAWSSSNTSIATVSSTGTITPKAAGSANITYTITGGCGGSTVSKYATLTVKPNAAAAQYTLTDNEQTYNGTACAVTVTPASGAGTATIYYTGTGGTSYAKSTTAPINAGTYAITVNADNGTNYCAANDLSVGTLTINKANQSTVSITNAGIFCAGSEVTALATGGSGTGSYSFARVSGTSGITINTSTGAITASNAGTITVNATRAGDANYNPSAASSNVTFTFSDGPAKYTLSAAGGTTICSAGGKLRLSGSESGFSYQLYKNGSAYRSPVEGTGSALEFDVFESGDYVCRAYLTSSPSCYTVMTGEVTLHISLTPTLIPATPTVTSYTPVTITSINTDILTWEISGEGNTAYLYDKTSNTVKVKASAAGSPYTIRATTSGGCSQTATLTVNADVEVCN